MAALSMEALYPKGIYHQYKSDVDLVANWLATTANANGYAHGESSASASSSSAAPAPPRLKGRARKIAKANEAKAPPTTFGSSLSNDGKPEQVATLNMASFVPMAEFIAKLEGIVVPARFSLAIERAIWVRLHFARRTTQRRAFHEHAHYVGHEWFARRLECVQTLLRPMMDSSDTNISELNAIGAKTEKRKDTLKYIFGVFDVYEQPCKAMADSPEVVIPSGQSKVEYVAEQIGSWAEVTFAYLALIVDLRRLRKELQTLWAEYQAGKLDIAAVAVATNTTFQIARDMEGEIKTLYQQGGVGTLIYGQYKALCNAVGIKAYMDQDPHTASRFNPAAYDIAKMCSIYTFCVLDSFLAATPKGTHLTSFDPLNGMYNEALGSDGSTKRIKFEQDGKLLMEMVPYFLFLSHDLCRGVVEDELTRGVGHMVNRHRKVPLWLAWAMQVYIEVVQGLGENVSRGHEEMKKVACKFKMSMLGLPASCKERQRVLAVVTKWDKDPVRIARAQLAQLDALKHHQVPSEFHFLRRNPIYCGLWIHSMRATFHCRGVEYATTTGAPIVAIQLYHALRHQGLLPDHLVWDDLEKFWRLQGLMTFFVGEAPMDRESYFKNYCLSIGKSTSNWAPVKGKAKFNLRKDKMRKARLRAWVSWTITQAYAPMSEPLPITADVVERILSHGRKEESLVVNCPCGRISDPEAGVAKKTAYQTPETVISLLRKLTEVIHSEVAHLEFDYFSMYNNIWSLLKKLNDELVRRYGASFPQHVPEENQLPFVVGYIFAAAAGQSGGNDGQGKSAPEGSPLDAANDVMSRFLEAGKGRVIKERAQRTVSPEKLAHLDFGNDDHWKLEKMRAEMIKRAVDMMGDCQSAQAAMNVIVRAYCNGFDRGEGSGTV